MCMCAGGHTSYTSSGSTRSHGNWTGERTSDQKLLTIGGQSGDRLWQDRGQQTQDEI